MPLPSLSQPPLREAPPPPRFRLKEDFPVLSQLLGESLQTSLEESFGAFLAGYGEPNNDRLLPTFLAATPGFGDRPELAELAAFEQALAGAANAPESGTLPPEELELLDPEAWKALRLGLHPSLMRVDTQWNTVALWRAIRQGLEPPSPQPDPEARTWAVWRQGGRPRFRALPPDDAWALDLAVRGRPFGDIARALCHWLPPREASSFAARMVADWTAAGWVTDLSLPRD